MSHPTKSGEVRGDLPGKPGPFLREGSGSSRERRPQADVGPGRVPCGRTWPCAAGASPWPVRGCFPFAWPGTFCLLTLGSPPSRADGAVRGARRLFHGLFGLWGSLEFGWILLGLSVFVSGLFGAIVLPMFPLLFAGFVVGGVFSYVRLLFLFCFAAALQVALFPSTSSWLLSGDLN